MVMDFQLDRVVRRLLSHRTCCRLRYTISEQRIQPSWKQRRLYRSSTYTPKSNAESEGGWQQRLDHFPPDKMGDYERYPMVTANQLRTRKERPRRVKMLTRDFIDGRSLRQH